MCARSVSPRGTYACSRSTAGCVLRIKSVRICKAEYLVDGVVVAAAAATGGGGGDVLGLAGYVGRAHGSLLLQTPT